MVKEIVIAKQVWVKDNPAKESSSAVKEILFQHGMLPDAISCENRG